MSVFGLASIDTEPLVRRGPPRSPYRAAAMRRLRDDSGTQGLILDVPDPARDDDRDGDGPTPAQLATGALSKLVIWLPAEVVTGYAAAVAMTQLPAPAEPVVDPLPWLISLVATPVLLLLVAMGKKGARKLTKAQRGRLNRRALLSVPAFALWSATVPFSVWTNWVDTTSPVFWYVLLLAAVAFTAFAEWFTRDR
jgi:hypothetical protein